MLVVDKCNSKSYKDSNATTHCQKNYWNVLAIFFWSKDLFWAQRQISKINEKDSVWKGDSDKKGNYCGKKEKKKDERQEQKVMNEWQIA